MMPRPLETLSCTYIILCLLIVMYITDWLIYLGSLKLQLLIFSAVFYQVSLEGHQTIYMCCSLFVCKGSTSYIESINQSVSLKKNICWYGTQKLPKNLNIYLRNYQTETAIFLATKHEKTIMACSYLHFSTQKIHQNSKKWWLLWIWCQCFWGSSED